MNTYWINRSMLLIFVLSMIPWYAQSNRLVVASAEQWNAHIGGVNAAAFSPQGSFLAVGGTYGLCLYPVVNGQVQQAGVQRPDVGSDITSLGFDARGTMATLVQFHWDTGRKSVTVRGVIHEPATPIGHFSHVYLPEVDDFLPVEASVSAVLNPQGTVLIVPCADGTIYTYRIGEGQATIPPYPEGGIFCHRVVTAPVVQSPVSLIHAPTSSICSVVFNAQGTLLAIGSVDGHICIYRVVGNGQIQMTNVQVINGLAGAVWAAFNPQGTLLAVAYANGTTRVFPVVAGRVQEQSVQELFGPHGSVYSIAFNASGTTLVVSGHHAPESDDTSACSGRAWRVIDGCVQDNPVELAGGGVAVFNPQGTLLALYGSSNSIAVYPVADGQLQTDAGAHLVGHSKKVLSVSFNPQGNVLASGLADDTARLWRIEGAPVRSQPALVEAMRPENSVLQAPVFEFSHAATPLARASSSYRPVETARQEVCSSFHPEQGFDTYPGCQTTTSGAEEVPECFICSYGADGEHGPLAVLPCSNSHAELVHRQCWERAIAERHSCPMCRSTDLKHWEKGKKN